MTAQSQSPLKRRVTVSQIPQLGEQPNQMIPPLKMLSKEDEATVNFAVETTSQKPNSEGMKKSQFTQGQAENHLYWGNLLYG